MIGHELTHGFDDQGRKFDAQGQPARLVDRGGREGVRSSAPAASPISTAGYTVAGDTKLNGRLTLGENTADNGGAAPRADGLPGRTGRQDERTSIDGFTPEQRVFLGWAQVWCENRAARIRAAAGRDQSALVGQVPRQRPGLEHAGVPEGVLVQGRRADGQAERLPGLVKVDGWVGRVVGR